MSERRELIHFIKFIMMSENCMIGRGPAKGIIIITSDMQDIMWGEPDLAA